MESHAGHEYILCPILCLELLDSVLVDVNAPWRIEKEIVLDPPLDLLYFLPCEFSIKGLLGPWLVLFISTLVLLEMLINGVKFFIYKLRIGFSKMGLHFAAKALQKWFDWHF